MRITTTVVVVFLAMNIFAAGLQTAGMDDKWGTSPEPGDAQALSDAQQEPDNINPRGGGLSTLFGLIVSVGSSLGAIFGSALPALDLLGDLGVPDYIILLMGGPLTILSGIEIADWLRGIS